MFSVGTFGSQLFAGTIPVGVEEELESPYDYWPLTINPSNIEFIEALEEDPTLRSELEYGAFQTGVNYTNPSLRNENFDFRYHFLTEADKRTLDLFQRLTVEVGITIFRWDHPLSERCFLVQLREPIKFSTEPRKSWTYMAEIHLIGKGTFGLGNFGEGYFGA